METEKIATISREEIEAVWGDVYRAYEQHTPNIYPEAIARLRAPFDLALQAFDRWIPVSERLPDTERAILAILATGDKDGPFGRGIEIVVGWHSIHADYWYARGEQVNRMHKAEITHWMPLPPPPPERP